MLITEAGEAPSTSQELAHQRPPLGNTASKTGARQTLLRHNGSPPSLFRHWNSHTYIHWKSHHLKVKHFASHFELKKFNFFRAPVPSTTSPVQGQRRRLQKVKSSSCIAPPLHCCRQHRCPHRSVRFQQCSQH